MISRRQPTFLQAKIVQPVLLNPLLLFLLSRCTRLMREQCFISLLSYTKGTTDDRFFIDFHIQDFCSFSVYLILAENDGLAFAFGTSTSRLLEVTIFALPLVGKFSCFGPQHFNEKSVFSISIAMILLNNGK